MEKLDEVLHKLDSWCKAYPLDMFPEPDPADLKWLHETRRGLCDRISAHMGRNMVVHMREMAGVIRDATEWRPMDCAPKDGRRILLRMPSGSPVIGRWNPRDPANPCDPTGWMDLPSTA